MQKKAKGDKDWSDVNDFPHPTTNMTVPNLKEGDEYQFRVIAVSSFKNARQIPTEIGRAHV